MSRSAGINQLNLVVTVRDLVAGTITEEWFSRSPLPVGRGSDSVLRLDADSVSSRHGAFLFASGSPLQYVDYGSTNGTLIDGTKIDPNLPVTLHDRSVVGIAPFMLIVRTVMAPPRDPPDDTATQTPVTTKDDPEPRHSPSQPDRK
jgi:pSer/pThr/pTyr-binding forkhead associated (FHA) protein